MAFSSSNPLSSSERILKASREHALENTGVFAVKGACSKAGIMLGLCLLSVIVTYAQLASGSSLSAVVMIGALIGSMAAYFAGLIVPGIAMVCGPVYAVCEGVLLGSFSSYVDSRFGKGLSIYALIGTVSIAGIIFAGYTSGFFKVTEKLKSIVITMGFALFVTYLANFILGFWGQNFTSITDVSLLGFAINIVSLAIGCFYLLIDFDEVYNLDGNADKRYEWVWGMGFLASVVWVYIEILKLLVKISTLLNGDD